jgi:hypothetical protein
MVAAASPGQPCGSGIRYDRAVWESAPSSGRSHGERSSIRQVLDFGTGKAVATTLRGWRVLVTSSAGPGPGRTGL